MHGMRPFGDLLSKEDALLALLGAAPRMTEVERVPLVAAVGRMAAEEVRAGIAVPPFDRAAMDGYAVRAQDEGPRRVVGEVFAGSRKVPHVGPGEACRIATGAPVPPGADAVVRVEDTTETDGKVTLTRAPTSGLSIERAGNDIARDAPVLARGETLTPARLGLLASVGHAHVEVTRRPRVALFTSGDELLRPGDTARPHAIYDSNTTTLSALFAAAGADVRPMQGLADDKDIIAGALRDAARGHDLIVFTGGASVGARDLIVDALRAEGEVMFHGVRVKPGKPLLAGRVGDALVLGLPGNPTSALSNAYLFVLPTLRAMQGLPPIAPRPARASLAADVKGEPDRHLFLPVRLDKGVARPTFKGSGALTSLAASDGYVGIPEGASLAAGTEVDVHLW